MEVLLVSFNDLLYASFFGCILSMGVVYIYVAGRSLIPYHINN